MNNEIKIKEGITAKEWVENFRKSLILIKSKEAKLKEIKMTFGDGKTYESRAIMTDDYEPRDEEYE
ncbi:MAG: hypothetical protein ACOC5T_06220 [Elusimicrobiota bacterium]